MDTSIVIKRAMSDEQIVFFLFCFVCCCTSFGGRKKVSIIIFQIIPFSTITRNNRLLLFWMLPKKNYINSIFAMRRKKRTWTWHSGQSFERTMRRTKRDKYKKSKLVFRWFANLFAINGFVDIEMERNDGLALDKKKILHQSGKKKTRECKQTVSSSRKKSILK
jgi:hypothetical protein